DSRWNHNWLIKRAIEGLEPYARYRSGASGAPVEPYGGRRRTSQCPRKKRKETSMSVGRILAQGLNYPRRFLGGRLGKGDPTPAAELTPGQGRVLQTPDGKLAVYRDEGSEVHAMSPTCTHLGCVVEFNGA